MESIVKIDNKRYYKVKVNEVNMHYSNQETISRKLKNLREWFLIW